MAIENLRKLPFPAVQKFQTAPGRTDAEVFLLEAQDTFVASRITFLNDLVDWASGGRPRQHGVLVAIPRRRTVFLHVLSGLGVLAALESIGASALAIFSQTPHSKLSPYTYYVAPDGRAEIVVLPDKSGGIVVQTVGMLADVLYGAQGLLPKP